MSLDLCTHRRMPEGVCLGTSAPLGVFQHPWPSPVARSTESSARCCLTPGYQLYWPGRNAWGCCKGRLDLCRLSEVDATVEVPEMPDIDLPYDDGEPLESHWHRLQINLLGDMLHQHSPERTDFFVGGNMFVYYSLEQARTRDYKGAGFLVVLGVDRGTPRTPGLSRQEEGRYPDVIVELLPRGTTMDRIWEPKKDLYERVIKTSEIFVSTRTTGRCGAGTWRTCTMWR